MITPTHISMSEGDVGASARSPFPASKISGQDRISQNSVRNGESDSPCKDRNVQTQRKLLVLVVDDEPALMRMWARIVVQAGHIPETAADGRGALEKYAAARPDLVISDFHMPNMSGLQLFRKLKAENP